MSARAGRYRRWFDYERDAHAKTLDSLQTVPETRRGERAFQKTLDLLAHIGAARALWLHRLGAAESGPTGEKELFPENVPLPEIEDRLDQMHRNWSEYLVGLDDRELDRVFEYRAFEGGRFQNRVEDILTQLFGHSWYHRGQVASLIRSLDGTPAVTDYVFWCRERL